MDLGGDLGDSIHAHSEVTGAMTQTTWQKQLTVDRRIVRLLSARTYEDFPGSIREMVSNSYDADATEVRIELDLDQGVLSVSDDGNGMTTEDFDLFLRIAGQQRGRRVSPEFARQRIGQFGIGFLAIFPFAGRVDISSTARRSPIRFQATIPTQEFVREEARLIDVQDVQIPGTEVSDPKFLHEHGTTIRVSGLTDMVHRYFKGSSIKLSSSRKTIRTWNSFDRFRWVLQEDLPLDYSEGSAYREAFSDLSSAGMRIWLNDDELFRNDIAAHVLENETWQFGDIKCRYVITTNWRSIQPSEARFLKQRLLNVGVGSRTSFGLGLTGRAYSRLHWLSGEIRILEGLDNLISIDRARFLDSPEYDQYAEHFRSRLAHYANHVEAISEAERDINRQLSDSRLAVVGPRRDVINRSIDKLSSRGFKVKSTGSQTGGENFPAVRVDVGRNVVEVVEDHPDLIDGVQIGEDIHTVRYERWDINKGALPAVRRGRDGTIEVNETYPLFRSRRYGAVFKKVLILLLLASEQAESSEALLSEIEQQLIREFSDLA